MAIEPSASRVNGFYNNMVKNYQKFSSKIDDLNVLLAKSDILIAHNAKFDLSLLANEYLRAGKEMPNKRAFLYYERIKTLCAYSQWRFRSKFR